LQVSSHLNDCINHIEPEAKAEPTPTAKSKKGKGKGKGKESEITGNICSAPKAPPHVSVAAIVGGMSAQKQRRILDRGVDVLVATPGRLWDIMEDVCVQPIEFVAFLPNLTFHILG
jgi:ATP-dependent RNA helicase DDX24/MAK5